MQSVMALVRVALLVATASCAHAQPLKSDSREALTCPSVPGAASIVPGQEASIQQQPATYLSCDGQVSVVFPAAPTTEPIVDDQLPVSAPGVQLKFRIVGRTTRDAHFSVGWGDYPHEVVSQKGPAQVLRDVEQGGIAGRGTLESDRELEIGGAPARLYTYTRTKIPGRGRVLAIMRGDRLYEISVQASSAETIDAHVTQEFLDSFKFVRCKK